VTQGDWATYAHHAVKLQENDYAKDLGHDEILEWIIINLQDSEMEDDESNDHDDCLVKVMTMTTTCR
jgi:hypothetical protein